MSGIWSYHLHCVSHYQSKKLDNSSTMSTTLIVAIGCLCLVPIDLLKIVSIIINIYIINTLIFLLFDQGIWDGHPSHIP